VGQQRAHIRQTFQTMQISQQRQRLIPQQGHRQAAEFRVDLNALGRDILGRDPHIETALENLAVMQGNPGRGQCAGAPVVNNRYPAP
jgi:hypothetical protein